MEVILSFPALLNIIIPYGYEPMHFVVLILRL